MTRVQLPKVRPAPAVHAWKCPGALLAGSVHHTACPCAPTAVVPTVGPRMYAPTPAPEAPSALPIPLPIPVGGLISEVSVGLSSSVECLHPRNGGTQLPFPGLLGCLLHVSSGSPLPFGVLAPFLPPVPASYLQVPILDHYAPAGVVCKVDANRAPADVWEAIAASLPK